ncbi:hypothetical protein CEXT_98501 [Caerostris extrusa]|uniref:Uncharacterized protein n=1 Tax=Caerostris extrusa TaxID=172846 RepID=A0AAV4XHR7_CAEEX|nr:hypothetical protein CEXT_98501 [Caerostris extrusa]
MVQWVVKVMGGGVGRGKEMRQGSQEGEPKRAVLSQKERFCDGFPYIMSLSTSSLSRQVLAFPQFFSPKGFCSFVDWPRMCGWRDRQGKPFAAVVKWANQWCYS